MARTLIVLGLVILLVGLLWPYLSRIGLGRLPGDIVIERENMENMTFNFQFSADDMFARQRGAQLGPLGREPLNRAV
jgi:hypothetical protein